MLNGANATQVYSGNSWASSFIDSKGNSYAGSVNSEGILYLNGTSTTLIFSSYKYWKYYYEDSKGNVYVSANAGNCGILKLNGSLVEQIYSVGSNFSYELACTRG